MYHIVFTCRSCSVHPLIGCTACWYSTAVTVCENVLGQECKYVFLEKQCDKTVLFSVTFLNFSRTLGL